MKKKRNFFRPAAAALALTLLLAGCGGSPDADGSKAPDDANNPGESSAVSAESRKVFRFGQAPYGDTLDMQISTRSLSATRTYPSLSDADSSLIPKTITDGGRTLTLADVQWLEAGEFYNATASYTGTATSKYATGYVITAEYAGEVVKTISGEMIYTAVFSGTPINAPVQNEPGAEDNSTETQPPEPAEPGSSSGSGLKWLLILPIGAGAAGLAFLGKFLLKKYKAKKEWKEYTT